MNHVEHIPLFYQFWFPSNATSHGYVVFQSFQGRSCVGMVIEKMQEQFANVNDGYSLRFKKLIPTDPNNGLYAGFGVKRLTLMKKNAPGDLADKYIGPSGVETVDFELSISARRKGNLGNFGALFKSLKSRAGGILIYDGITFSEASADIRVGNRLRKIPVFGSGSDAGVIDITDDVKTGPDGHPTFTSLVEETDETLAELHSTLTGL